MSNYFETMSFVTGTQARNMMINEIRELAMTDISCELSLYGSAELGTTTS